MRVEAINSMEDTLSETFGIVSVWKYAGVDMGIFQCESSFNTPRIVSFSDPSKKLHNQKYLFKAQNDEIFFFCKEKSKTEEEVERFYMCIINNEKEHGKQIHTTSSKRLEENVTKYDIEAGSDLEYMLINQVTQSDEKLDSEQKP